jgi:predicted O-linked N-acetylglucosamine transferase (SPINDLY family)
LAAEKAVSLDPKQFGNHHALLNSFNYLPAIELDAYKAKILRFSQEFEVPLQKHRRTLQNRREDNRRLKIAYLSPDFRTHSVSYFIQPIIAGHSRSNFEVFCLYSSPCVDATTRALQRTADRWLDVSRLSDGELDAMIRHHEIDILVDLACHTDGNRLLVFSRRPAPIHITMIGMQQTTGLESMDYRVTDADMDPPGMTEKYHTETLLRLKRAFVFQPPQSAVFVQPPPALRNGHITFGSFNNFAKTHPAVLQTWARILTRIPHSRMGAVVPKGAVFEEYFTKAGIAPERVYRMDRRTGDDYLRMHHEVDIALDCFPFAGLTVSLFAAWMGVPTLTIAGEISSARGGVSINRGLGLEEWIAKDPDDFVDKAVAFARDVDGLARLRASMRERMERELTNVPKFMKDYESHLRHVWRDWCASTECRAL